MPRKGNNYKLTAQVHKQLVTHIGAALPFREACAMAGVDDYTVRLWIERGREKIRIGSDQHPTALLVKDFDKASAHIQAILLGTVTRATQPHTEIAYETDADGNRVETGRVTVPGKPDLALKLLKMRWPDNYAERHEVSGPGGGAIPLTSASVDEVLLRAARLTGRSGRRAVEALAQAALQAPLPPRGDPLCSGGAPQGSKGNGNGSGA